MSTAETLYSVRQTEQTSGGGYSKETTSTQQYGGPMAGSTTHSYTTVQGGMGGGMGGGMQGGMGYQQGGYQQGYGGGASSSVMTSHSQYSSSGQGGFDGQYGAPMEGKAPPPGMPRVAHFGLMFLHQTAFALAVGNPACQDTHYHTPASQTTSVPTALLTTSSPEHKIGCAIISIYDIPLSCQGDVVS
jgi:hypothetical protein